MKYLLFIVSLLFSITILPAARCAACWHKTVFAQEERPARDAQKQAKLDQELAEACAELSEPERRRNHPGCSALEQYLDCHDKHDVRHKAQDRASFYNLLLQKIVFLQEELARSCTKKSDNARRRDEYKRMLRFHLQGLADIGSKELGDSFEHVHSRALGHYGSEHDLPSLEQELAMVKAKLGYIATQKQQHPSLSTEHARMELFFKRELLKLHAVIGGRRNQGLYKNINPSDYPEFLNRQLNALSKARSWQVVQSSLSAHDAFDEFREEIAGEIHKHNLASLVYAEKLKQANVLIVPAIVK